MMVEYNAKLKMRKLACTILVFMLLSNIVVQASESLVKDIVQWVRSEGGYFNERLEMRRVDPDDLTSYFGVFAKEDIDSKELLMHIPPSCYIEVFDKEKDTNVETEEDSSEAYHQNLCALSKHLMGEMKLGEKSRYAPYIAYLKTQKAGQLPANWSKAGKDLLRRMLVQGSDGVDWIDRYYRNSCIGDDPFEIHMMEMTVQRCFDTALIPIWDMVNHDNGRVNTHHSSIYDKEGLKVEAKMAIKAGEEILASYDMCADCRDISTYWGTPEILRDFGFVERYPTRWVFFGDKDDDYVWFEIHQDKEGDKYVYFDDTDDYDGSPSRRGIRILQNEIERLYLVGEELESYRGTMPTNEYDIAALYYKTAMHDLSMAVEQALWDLNIKETGDEL